MSMIDPELERVRLAARYAAMSGLELERVGGDPEALTEWARSALLAEMTKRGLEWKPEPRIAKPVAEDEILIRLGAYLDRNAAALDRDLLENVGIKAFFCEEEHSIDDDASDTKHPRQTQLLVRSKDLTAARHQMMQWHEVERTFGVKPSEVTAGDRPVILRRYRDMPTAFVEKSVLENAGIQCLLRDSWIGFGRMPWVESS
jgi:hypothetical protein